MSSSSNSARLRIRQASHENAVEMSASMPATLRTAKRNRYWFRTFSEFLLGTGDVIFVAARDAHRFHSITQELVLLVIFAPARKMPEAKRS